MEFDIKAIAQLAHIALRSDEEIKLYQSQIKQVMALVDQVQSLDLEGVEPMIHPHEFNQRLREDKAWNLGEGEQKESPNTAQSNALANATEKKDGFYLTPLVIEQQ